MKCSNSKSETEIGSIFAIIVLRPFGRLRTSLRFFAKIIKSWAEGEAARLSARDEARTRKMVVEQLVEFIETCRNTLRSGLGVELKQETK